MFTTPCPKSTSSLLRYLASVILMPLLYRSRPSFIRDYAVARLEKAGQFLFCKCMRYVLALFQFWGLRNNNPCHAVIAKIFNEFPDDQRPDIAGAACLRIPPGAPCVNHFLCKDATVCEMVCAMPVKIFQVLRTGMFIPCAGCFSVADKVFDLPGETGTIGAHISRWRQLYQLYHSSSQIQKPPCVAFAVSMEVLY